MAQGQQLINDRRNMSITKVNLLSSQFFFYFPLASGIQYTFCHLVLLLLSFNLDKSKRLKYSGHRKR